MTSSSSCPPSPKNFRKASEPLGGHDFSRAAISAKRAASAAEGLLEQTTSRPSADFFEHVFHHHRRAWESSSFSIRPCGSSADRDFAPLSRSREILRPRVHRHAQPSSHLAYHSRFNHDRARCPADKRRVFVPGEERTRHYRRNWQRGYVDHRVRDASDYAQHRAYIHANPVRAKLVMEPRGFAYSSACGDFALDPPPQWLKPLSKNQLVGTTEVVPSRSARI